MHALFGRAEPRPESLAGQIHGRTAMDEADSVEITTIDGLRVEYADGFGLIRASNTTPVLVLRFEAETLMALEKIQDDFRNLLEKNINLKNLPF